MSAEAAADLNEIARKLEAIAMEIPAPNEHTPKLMMLAVLARQRAQVYESRVRAALGQ